MDQSRSTVSHRAATLVLAAFAVFAVLCFAFAGVTILENGTTTAKVAPHSGPSLG
jgi:hypothetical protein